MGAIYTIGYGNRGIDEFIALLRQYKIDYLIDVRSQPYSKFAPDFSQKRLSELLQKHNIRYVFMGDSLGGRPTDPDCYDAAGKVDYEKVRTKAFFQDGISRLRKASAQPLDVVLMCAELRPEHCHRSRLIGRALDGAGLPVQHIDEHGQLKSQEALYKTSQLGLFAVLPPVAESLPATENQVP